MERQYLVDGVLGLNYGWASAPLGSINIGVSDTNFHYLTVVSPAQYADPRVFNMRLASTNGASAVFNVNEITGYSHVFQYIFRGDVALWADATGGTNAIVQALFLDDAPATYSAATAPAAIAASAMPSFCGMTMLGNGAFQFSFSNSLPWSIRVLTTTNLLLPLTNWTTLGAPSNIAPGLFQFTSQPAASETQRFYTVCSP
jgi:hypothetical protein